MTKYELLVLTSDNKKESEKIYQFIKNLMPKIIKEEIWGLRKLAYKINHKDFGTYYWFILEADNSALKKFRKERTINKHFYRFLLINLDEEFANPAKYIAGKLKTKVDPALLVRKPRKMDENNADNKKPAYKKVEKPEIKSNPINNEEK